LLDLGAEYVLAVPFATSPKCWAGYSLPFILRLSRHQADFEAYAKSSTQHSELFESSEPRGYFLSISRRSMALCAGIHCAPIFLQSTNADQPQSPLMLGRGETLASRLLRYLCPAYPLRAAVSSGNKVFEDRKCWSAPCTGCDKYRPRCLLLGLLSSARIAAISLRLPLAMLTTF
jgi:hypothetical protein